MIRREVGVFLCNDHPEFATDDEYVASFHMRTAHSVLWQQLEGIAVVPVTAPSPEPGKVRRPRPATRPERRRDSRRGGRR